MNKVVHLCSVCRPVGELLFLDMFQSKYFVFGVEICRHCERLVWMFLKVLRAAVSISQTQYLYVCIYAHGDSSDG
jgi:hypothetical protein